MDLTYILYTPEFNIYAFYAIAGPPSDHRSQDHAASSPSPIVFSVVDEEFLKSVIDEGDSDPPVALTLRSKLSLIKSLKDDTEAVPFTYTINGHEIQFGREEFCLITGLRFGVEFSDDYLHGPLDLRRRVWESHVDGNNIIGQMLIDKILSEEFYSLRDEDAVAVCLLAVLHMVLLGQEPKNNVPKWWLSLVDDINMWEKYPWGSYIWPKLYRQLKDANPKRWDRFYASLRGPIRRPAKYTLSGFTWAFKTWILEAYKERALNYYTHVDRHPRAVAWVNGETFYRSYLEPFFEGAEPIRRLRADAFEAKAECISYQQAWRGKEYGLEKIRGSPYESFEMLPYYLHNLERKNKGTVTRIKIDEGVFEMLFIALGASIRKFVNHLRPLLIIDAAHLKGQYKGTNLVAVGMDGKNQIVPITFGICKGETGPCWSWWMSVLKECIGDNPNLLFISNKHASIALAVRNEFPLAFHAQKNLEATWTYSKQFSLMRITSLWKSVLKDGQEPIAHLYANIKHEITDWVADKVHKRKLKSALWVVNGIDPNLYQVYDGGRNREVNLMSRPCQCRKWQLSGIPCGHVIAVTRFLGLIDCVQFVADWFKKEKYQGTYAESIHFVGDMHEWELPSHIHPAIPPRMDNPQPGRPKNTNRILSQGEEPRTMLLNNASLVVLKLYVVRISASWVISRHNP
ncbi:transposase, MuDR, MULE transposase domain protein [Tanacetum coccineum]